MLHEFNAERKRDFYEFDSIIEFAEFVDANLPKNAMARIEPASSWHNYQTWDDAMKRAVTGNREDVKELFENLSALSVDLRDAVQQEVRDVSGEYFDVAEYLSGEPECFRAMTMQDSGKPIIPVIVNCSQPGATDADTIINRGTAIVALCDELEREGYVIDLKVVFASKAHNMKASKKYPNRNCYQYTEVKVQSRPMDIDGISFCVINPAFLRRLYIGLLEYSYGVRDAGCFCRIGEYDIPEDSIDDVPGFYFKSRWMLDDGSRYRTLERAKEHVLKMVKEFSQNPHKLVTG